MTASLLLLYASYAALGWALLRALGVQRRAAPGGLLLYMGIGTLLGLGASTVVLFALELTRVRLTLAAYVAASVAVAALLGRLRRREGRAMRWPSWRELHPATAVACLALAFPITLAMWRALALPVTPRDAIVGMDLVAQYAAEEGRLASSLFSVEHLQGKLSNQPYYAPFTALSQTLGYLGGAAYGKAWLAALPLGLVMMLGGALRQTLHPAFAAALVASLVAAPAFYGYSFMVLADYASAAFFGLGALALYRYRGKAWPGLQISDGAVLALASVAFGFATWSRSETLGLVVPLALAVAVKAWPLGRGPALRRALLLGAGAVAAFVLWHVVFIPFYLGGGPANLLAWDGARALGTNAARLAEQLSRTDQYGYVLALGAIGAAVSLVCFQSERGLFYLFTAAVVVAGLLVLVSIAPAASAVNTAKRGFFRLLPLVVLYLGVCPALTRPSDWLTRWERGEAGLGSGSGNAAPEGG